jgi:hypothetical protein
MSLFHCECCFLSSSLNPHKHLHLSLHRPPFLVWGEASWEKFDRGTYPECTSSARAHLPRMQVCHFVLQHVKLLFAVSDRADCMIASPFCLHESHTPDALASTPSSLCITKYYHHFQYLAPFKVLSLLSTMPRVLP